MGEERTGWSDPTGCSKPRDAFHREVGDRGQNRSPVGWRDTALRWDPSPHPQPHSPQLVRVDVNPSGEAAPAGDKPEEAAAILCGEEKRSVSCSPNPPSGDSQELIPEPSSWLAAARISQVSTSPATCRFRITPSADRAGGLQSWWSIPVAEGRLSRAEHPDSPEAEMIPSTARAGSPA